MNYLFYKGILFLGAMQQSEVEPRLCLYTVQPHLHNEILKS